MSHVATVEIEVKDIDALRAACRRIGLEFCEGQQTYRWWGYSAGDYPLPDGFTTDDLGKCEHALRLPLVHAAWAGKEHALEYMQPYEVGVVRRRDGRPGYTLLWDFFSGGNGLQGVVGENCAKLKQAYAIEVARRKAISQGYRVNEVPQAGGAVRLVLSR